MVVVWLWLCDCSHSRPCPANRLVMLRRTSQTRTEHTNCLTLRWTSQNRDWSINLPARGISYEIISCGTRAAISNLSIPHIYRSTNQKRQPTDRNFTLPRFPMTFYSPIKIQQRRNAAIIKIVHQNKMPKLRQKKAVHTSTQHARLTPRKYN